MDLNKEVKFVIKPSGFIVCSICGKVFTNPVINVRCGHTFCLRCVEETGVTRDGQLIVRCPEDETECKASDLVVNRLDSKLHFRSTRLHSGRLTDGSGYKVVPMAAPGMNRRTKD